jgi:uncharacterized membrane protein
VNNPRLLHRLAVGAYLALIALLLAWMVWLDPLPARIASPMLLLLVGPLLIPLRAILHGRRYTMAWSSMLILLYFLHGAAAVASGGRAVWLGALEIALVLSYFSLAILYVRRSRPAQQESGSSSGR